MTEGVRIVVENILVQLTGKHGDVMHGRHGITRPILDKHSVVNRVPGPSLLHSVLRHCLGSENFDFDIEKQFITRIFFNQGAQINKSQFSENFYQF